eukprot:UN12082
MNGLITLVLWLLSVVNSLQYNVGTANRMCEYALASYCVGNGGHGVPSWTCDACKKQPGMVNITIVKTGFLNYNSHAFVGYDSVHKVIIVAFAGTDPLSMANWIDDIGFEQIKYPLSSSCNCYVHKGFYETYNAVRTTIWNAVSNLRTLYGTSTQVQITGHSLGAALAAHCTLDGFISHSIKAQYTYTYGQPRVGDQAFATFYEHYINDYGQLHFHVTHRK